MPALSASFAGRHSYECTLEVIGDPVGDSVIEHFRAASSKKTMSLSYTHFWGGRGGGNTKKNNRGVDCLIIELHSWAEHMACRTLSQGPFQTASYYRASQSIFDVLRLFTRAGHVETES